MIVSLKTGQYFVRFILCCLFLTFFFILFPEIIVRLIFCVLSNFSVMIQAKGWKSLWILSFICREFLMHWLGSALCLFLISIINLQLLTSWKFLKVMNLLLADLHRLNTNIFIVYKQIILNFLLKNLINWNGSFIKHRGLYFSQSVFLLHTIVPI